MGICVDKVIKDFEKDGSVEVKKVASGLFIDSIYEIKKLEGESFIKSAIELMDAANRYDYRWMFETED